ncbi:MAG: toprim domain-containing protein, partial [Verrucomicrobia bacterium]|nr:toprim domain-containing protein [Verrucomicrobiota bacterium]
MARIPEDVIERLKSEVSLERLVQAHGVELKRHGADLIGLCPLHNDKSPSLVVSPKKNLWHCLGACQRGGSVIDWVMATREVSFRHAVEILNGDIPEAPAAKRVALPSPVQVDAEDHELLRQVLLYYHETLKQSPEALAYLEQRGLKHAEVIDTFCLGFANRTLGYRLPGRAARERLQKLGVLRESGHEHLNGSLIVPLLGEGGEVLGMYGRKITPAAQLRKGTPLHLYLPGPHRGVFNVHALKASKTVILCEALIDALTFWCAGFRNVTSSYGTSGFTDDHLSAFKRHGTETVLIAYDRDDAGERAASALAEKLIAQGITCYRIQFPKGMDANEYALKVTPAEKSLGVLARNAVWLGKGKAPAVVDLVAASKCEPEASTSADVIEAPIAAPPPEAACDVEASDAFARASSSLAALAAKNEAGSGVSGEGCEGEASIRETGNGQRSTSGDEVAFVFGDRRYRVRGLAKNLAHGALKVNLLVSRRDSVHVDTLDLYSSRQRAAFVKQAAAELGAAEETIKTDVGQVLMRLEQLQDEQIQEALKPKAKEVTLSESERAAALE